MGVPLLLPLLGVWCRTVMGDEGVPQGVVGLSEATGVKPGRDWRPVPPITAMGMGPGSGVVSWC